MPAWTAGRASSASYIFDSFGNLSSITTTDSTDPLNPVTTPRPIGVSTATNRLTGASYDGSGNVTSLFTLSSFTYDPFNRVTHLVGTGVNKSFLYDTGDNRVAILDHQAQTEEWHLRGLHDKVVRSFLSSPEGWSWKQDWVFREGRLVGSTSPAKWREYHLDHLGSPRLVTGPIGLKVAEYHPFPFGEMASENGPGVDESENLFRYTGHERDVNCEDGSCAPEGQDDLDYMLARFYSPVMGRFLGVDPQVFQNPDIPQGWNRFTYTRNNPVQFIDPDGEQVLPPSEVAPSPEKFLRDFRNLLSNLEKQESIITTDVPITPDDFEAIDRSSLPPDFAKALREIKSGQDRPNVRNPKPF